MNTINEYREPLELPERVIQDLERIKDLGYVNMYSKNQLLATCIKLGYYSTAIWISDNFYLYLKEMEKEFESSP
ncbi:MAG TPA: hypothetical protein DEG17_00155 [Cyanobacteria bacterium UBA11149]|nr:hypothetical protein [Cyanobacteria bacterium UBA11367]HBE60383.1 hypothetical protein [Cyanobacteria bacterium UBA11366]HBK65934.1 hypothetical protein [Cyanobacteria bacterium UBA11166]HBR73245.1 hypothetical protein [Cyanobacteria bacterium UBA11159]HBS71730.1 hypothetical protein [Cyanobacteria bacterium UBA11153]HBW87333.1 hypothetical protein [Cyanobacteria bacterium UBA11149]HCA96226.1 hypothetical protein [Cyanobacteria bacterium UBA9226]